MPNHQELCAKGAIEEVRSHLERPVINLPRASSEIVFAPDDEAGSRAVKGLAARGSHDQVRTLDWGLAAAFDEVIIDAVSYESGAVSVAVSAAGGPLSTTRRGGNMQRTIGRIGLGIATGLAFFAFSAASALATTVTTEPASQVTTTTAVLNGAIDTGGVATAWQFQWGTTSKYGHGTPVEQIPAGNATVPVSWQLSGLKPNTTYHFRLVASTGTGSTYYPLNPIVGRDETFKTQPTGRMKLLRHRLIVHNGFVTVPLSCVSGITCHGRFTISTLGRVSGTRAFANVLCATTFFTIQAHRTGNIRVRVRFGCLALLNESPSHSVVAKLTSNPRTGQKALITNVVLKLG